MAEEEAREAGKIIQAALNTLHQKNSDLLQVRSSILRLREQEQKLMKAVDSSRRQVVAELAKLDPAGFSFIGAQADRLIPAAEREVSGA